MIKKLILGKGLFGKAKYTIPNDFLEKCFTEDENGKKRIIYTESNDSKIVLSTSPLSVIEDSEEVNPVYMKKNGEATYKDITGFFMYKGEIFYKPKNGSGKNVKTEESFQSFAKSSWDGDGKPTTTAISGLVVTPLEIY